MSTNGAKAKTIRKILSAKIENWADTIEDQHVRAAVKRDTIVTGGSIASLFLGEMIKDFDIYFRTIETTRAVAAYYVAKFNQLYPNRNGYTPEVKEWTEENGEERVTIYVQSAGVATGEEIDDNDNMFGDSNDQYLKDIEADILGKQVKEPLDVEDKPKYRPVFMSANAITLSDKVQLVIRFHGSPEDIHKNFDFTHAKCWYDHGDNTLHTPELALQCLLSRTLHYSGSLYPICSIFRAKKFIERGWKISAGELLKMAWQVNKLDLNNIKVVREQLTGVDATYLHMVCEALESWKTANPDDDLSSNYVVSIIDKVFGV